MKSPLDDGQLVVLESVDSTQNVASQYLKEGRPFGAILAHEQTGGRGRFDRVWLSPQGECLAASLAFRSHASHSRPYLIGMALAIASAQALGCSLRWPNDLVVGERKLGGILTEMMPDATGQIIPVVGIGVNLSQFEFPEGVAAIATSLRIERGVTPSPDETLSRILARLELIPEPQAWADLAPHWMPFDRTPGKRYRLLDGVELVATDIGAEGQLIGTSSRGSQVVLAAEAIFGS